MVSRYALKRNAGILVDAIYPHLKDREFTSIEAAGIVGRKGTAVGGTLGALAARGVVEHPNGDKRGHYTNRISGPTQWRFTKHFTQWYESCYLPGIRN